MMRCQHGNLIRACLQCSAQGQVSIGDRSDGERFVTRERNKVLGGDTTAIVIKERIERVLRYPEAGDGIFAVY